jgi:ribosomal protein S27AE
MRGAGHPAVAEENAMDVPSMSFRKRYLEARTVNMCAQCGESLFLPEWSEYLSKHRVRHLWECEACGYKFETLVAFAASEPALA